MFHSFSIKFICITLFAQITITVNPDIPVHYKENNLPLDGILLCAANGELDMTHNITHEDACTVHSATKDTIAHLAHDEAALTVAIMYAPDETMYAINVNGNTPLHNLAYRKQYDNKQDSKLVELIRAMLRFYTSEKQIQNVLTTNIFNIRNLRGRTALDIAREQNNKSFLDVYREYFTKIPDINRHPYSPVDLPTFEQKQQSPFATNSPNAATPNPGDILSKSFRVRDTSPTQSAPPPPYQATRSSSYFQSICAYTQPPSAELNNPYNITQPASVELCRLSDIMQVKSTIQPPANPAITNAVLAAWNNNPLV